VKNRWPDLGRGVAAAAALSLAALGAVLFLDADEAQAATMLANHARALDAFVEATEELIEAFSLAELNPHAFLITSSRETCWLAQSRPALMR
jgi:hypothetical protein